MTNPSIQTPTSPRDWWVSLGMTVSATSAALSSFDGLRSLALAAGWTTWMAPLLPLTVDAFAATATRVWLAGSTRSQRARRFARNCAVGAILLSLVGNAVWHLIAAELLPVTWIVVLCVGTVPAGVLGLVSHLAVLRRQVDPVVPLERVSTDRTVRRTTPGPMSSTEPKPINHRPEDAAEPTSRQARQASAARSSRPRYGDEAVLLAAARAADIAYRESHEGKPITRDALRAELRIGGERATKLLRRLRAETDKQALSIPRHEGP